MSAEEVVKLFDSRWFGHGIETQYPKTPQEQNPDLEIEEEPKKTELSRLPTLHVRSLSDQSSLFFSSDQDSVSPSSVLTVTTPRLQTIVSGKVMKEEPRIEERIVAVSEKKGCKRSRRKKLSKSLSELEFDELKGFMDLGFVFSEEDKDSSLVSIIPGLQRFGSRGEEDNKVHEHNHNHVVGVSRPYLSEAWEVMEEKKKEKKPVMIDWRMADLSNEMDVKDHLKFWAHSVASAVR